MSVLGLVDVSKPSSNESLVSLTSLAEMTGFPVDYIKRELVLEELEEMSADELRARVLNYLESSF